MSRRSARKRRQEQPVEVAPVADPEKSISGCAVLGCEQLGLVLIDFGAVAAELGIDQTSYFCAEHGRWAQGEIRKGSVRQLIAEVRDGESEQDRLRRQRRDVEKTLGIR